MNIKYYTYYISLNMTLLYYLNNINNYKLYYYLYIFI